jgi:hypothetical protein
MSDETLRRIEARGVRFEEQVVDDQRYVRVSVADEDAVPAEMGFLLSDFVVNARSSLDMALHQLVHHHDLFWSRPYFPLTDGEDTKAWRDFHGQALRRGLNEHYVEAIKGIQPTLKPWGGDYPAYHTGIELRDLANANKHRRLTPVLRRLQIRGFIHAGPHADIIISAEDSMNPWEPDEQTVAVMQAPSHVPLDSFRATRPSGTLALLVDAGEDVGYEIAPGFRLPINLGELLDRGVKFVGLALRRLEEAERAEMNLEEPLFSTNMTL